LPIFQLLPAEVRFYDWFEKGAANMLEAARLLRNLVDDYTNVESRVAQITETEHQGDFVVHEVFELLHQTFITPLERETITALITSMDDVVDHIEASADTMLLYKIDRPTDDARRLAEIIYLSAEQIFKAIPLLRQKKTVPQILTHVIEVNRLENEADRVTRMATAKLIDHPDQLFELYRWGKIYESLEETTDRCEDVSDALRAALLEQA